MYYYFVCFSRDDNNIPVIEYILYQKHESDNLERGKTRLASLASWQGFRQFRPDKTLIGGYWVNNVGDYLGTCLIASPIALDKDGNAM